MNRSVFRVLLVFLALALVAPRLSAWHRLVPCRGCAENCPECGEVFGDSAFCDSAFGDSVVDGSFVGDSTFCGPAFGGSVVGNSTIGNSVSDFSPSYYTVGERRSLFNGVDLTGWTDLEGTGPAQGWTVEDGAICHPGKGSNLYTAEKFDNFILDFEFQLDVGTNSGVKYKTWQGEDWGMGCEYQVFDDASAPDQAPRYKTGSLYDVYAPVSPEGLLKREGFNHGRIVVMGNYVEHWLNGVRTVATTIDSAPWKKRVASSKFADEPKFGHIASSPIFLQDHGTPVRFRNITVTELEPYAPSESAFVSETEWN